MNAKYAAYLTSPDWRRRRELVFKRDSYKCQGCLTALAEVVHHRTYEHVGNELLYELVALCQSCHDRAHGKENGNAN